MSAVYLQRLCLEKYSGTTVRFRLTWVGVSICCTAFFWGIAAVIWIKVLYPKFAGWIEKIPMLWGYVLTWILVVFMAVNILVSMAALVRYDMRANGKRQRADGKKVIDEHFDDERMDRIYPNAKPR